MKRGDTVRAKIYRERKNSREFICAKVGRVEFIHLDQVCIRFGEGKPEMVKAMDVEKLNNATLND